LLGFVGIHVKPITAQEKFNFPRANAILARTQALLWVRDWYDSGNQSEKLYYNYYTSGKFLTLKFKSGKILRELEL
jgi:hypothetical protein